MIITYMLLTPMMMHPWMKVMLLMLMMSMLIIMIMMIILMMIMIITMISMFPDRTRAGPGPDPGRTGPDQAGPSQTSPKYIIFSQNIESTIVYNPG